MQQHDVKCSVKNRSRTQCRSSKNNPCLGDLQRNIQSIESIENQADVDTTDAGKKSMYPETVSQQSKNEDKSTDYSVSFP